MNFMDPKDSILSGERLMDFVKTEEDLETSIIAPKSDRLTLVVLLMYT
jgi:hypothetical protein